MIKRRPSVAGYFYPSNSKELLHELQQYISEHTKVDALGAVCPHAGYLYSGHVAGAVYSRIKPKDIFILLGPNHTGYGAQVSIMTEGEWEIPFGSIKIHENLAKKVVEKLNFVSDEIKAHLYEHSLEVQLPFIYKINPDSKIVPLTLKTLSIKECEILGQGIAEAIKELGLSESTIIVSSTDMSHYLPDEIARKTDSLAIEKIRKFDPEGLYNTVVEHKISMCGFIPTVTMLWTTKALGAKEVQIIKYTTSAEVSRDYKKVVGYLGAIIL